MIRSDPGIYPWYPSSMCSKYYTWFVDLGYENLDIVEHSAWFHLSDGSHIYGPDGTWSIIEYYHTPMLPSSCRWNYVLMDIKHTPITKGFIEKYVAQLDLTKRQAWDIAEAKTRAMEEEKARLDRHAEDTAEKAKNAILSNPALVERIAEKGLQEINLDKIVKHIPRHQKNGLKGVKLL